MTLYSVEHESVFMGEISWRRVGWYRKRWRAYLAAFWYALWNLGPLDVVTVREKIK